MPPLTIPEALQELLKKKSPLRSSHPSGDLVFYWFLEDPVFDGELTNDKVLIDKDCQLPLNIFKLLPIDSLVGDMCCLYFSKEEAFRALEIAVDRFQKMRVG